MTLRLTVFPFRKEIKMRRTEIYNINFYRLSGDYFNAGLMKMNSTETGEACFQWLYDSLDANATTLEELNYSFKQRNFGGVFFITLLSLLGTIGNIHVLWIYIRKFRPSSYRTYILCLAFLDLTNCTVGMPLTILYLNYPLMYPSDVFCKIYRFLLYYVSVSSTVILVIIAVDRYRKICHPLKRQLTEKETFFLCLFGLFLALLFSWPAPCLYGHSSIHFPRLNLTGHRCFTSDDLQKQPFQKIFNSFLTLLFVVIFTLLTVLYYFIFKAVKTHVVFQSRNRQFPQSTKSKVRPLNIKEIERRTYYHNLRRTTITLLMVTIGYIASALPHHALAISIFVNPILDCQMSFTNGVLFYTFVWIFLVNNVINPVIYSFSDRRFARHVKDLYKGCLCKHVKHVTSAKTESVDS